MKKVLYLLGAGATHAEVLTTSEELDDNRFGLLISGVTNRVMKKALQKKHSWFKKNSQRFTSAKGGFNIELLISLLESNRVPVEQIRLLKSLIENDIKKVLSPSRSAKFYLHKALFELHNKIEDRESLLGVVSLNYDNVVDDAYVKLSKDEPNYYRAYEKQSEGIPILKLHGSFKWDIPIMPIGINKNYLFPPYNFIWSKTYELLTKCDVLRIIGCSLSQNDIGLIDLLLKAHLNRSNPIEIQIIDFQNAGERIKNNYGFFSGILSPIEIEDHLIAIEPILKGFGNPFRIWLKSKAERMLKDDLASTVYLIKCL